MDHLVAPSILSADFAELRKEVEMVNESQADLFHIDVMDGVFVPNISLGLPVIKSIHRYAEKPLDVHLMIINPDNYIEKFRDAGAEYISVHYETCNHLHRSLQKIKSTGAKAGVALNPHTGVRLLEEILPYSDFILIMSVNPGFGGQEFIRTSYSKIRELRKLIQKVNRNILIEVDGGVTLDNAGKLLEAGTDILVAGNTVFRSKNPLQVIRKLKEIGKDKR